jgi:hypothetical protein
MDQDLGTIVLTVEIPTQSANLDLLCDFDNLETPERSPLPLIPLGLYFTPKQGWCVHCNDSPQQLSTVTFCGPGLDSDIRYAGVRVTIPSQRGLQCSGKGHRNDISRHFTYVLFPFASNEQEKKERG